MILAACALAVASVACSKLPTDSEGRILVTVRSFPSGATVTASDGEMQTTPAEFAVPPGTRTKFIIRLEGYETQTIVTSPAGGAPIDRAGRDWNLSLFDLITPSSAIGMTYAGMQRQHQQMVPNPISVDLRPLDGELPELPGEREEVSLFGAWCSRPIEVEQDCSSWDGPTRRVMVRGLPVKLSGSEESGGVLVVPILLDSEKLAHRPIDHGTRACTRVMRSGLSLGAELLRVVEIWSDDQVYGCYLQFSEPVYGRLRAFPAAHD